MKRQTWRTIALLALALFVVLTVAGTDTRADTVTIEQTVLLDQNGIKITAKSIDMDGLFGPEVKMLFENNSDKSVTIQVRNASVNGYMVDPVMSVDVTPGNKANSQMRIMKSELERAGITTIASIELSFHVFDSDSWDTIFDSNMVRIETSAANNYQYDYDNTGDQVFHDNDIEIVIKGLATKDSYLGKQVVVYISNGSNRNITVQARNCSVNGFMIDPVFSCDVVAGKHAVDTMTISNKKLEENEIQTIETIELSFHVFDEETWDAFLDTPTITWHCSYVPDPTHTPAPTTAPSPEPTSTPTPEATSTQTLAPATPTATPAPVETSATVKRVQAKKSLKLQAPKAKGNAYQWYVRTSKNAPWQSLGKKGAKDKLSVKATMAMDGYQYRCEIRSASGVRYTDTYELYVYEQLKVKKQPKWTKKVLPGAKMTLTITAQGANSYQWVTRPNGSSPWAKIEGATGTSYVVDVQEGMAGRQYACQISGKAGTAQSKAAVVKIAPWPKVKFSKQPVLKKPVVPGSWVTLTVKAQNADTYQWYYRTSAKGAWILYSGATQPNLTFQVGAGTNGYQYKCTAKGRGGTVDSKPVTLKVVTP